MLLTGSETREVIAALGAHADDIVGRSHSDANIAREERLHTLAGRLAESTGEVRDLLANATAEWLAGHYGPRSFDTIYDYRAQDATDDGWTVAARTLLHLVDDGAELWDRDLDGVVKSCRASLA